jgi:hypothetical protein
MACLWAGDSAVLKEAAEVAQEVATLVRPSLHRSSLCVRVAARVLVVTAASSSCPCKSLPSVPQKGISWTTRDFLDIAKNGQR